MKFKAKIPLNFMQSREAKLMGDENITHSEVEFDFQDILGNSNDKILDKPLFQARELIIPWLRKGNIPELIEDK